MNWYLTVLQKYADFNGRARRMEFWMYVLFNFLIAVVLNIVDSFVVVKVAGYPLLGPIYTLAVLIPGIAVAVRRLHDSGKSGWWILIGLVPCIGFVVLIVFYVMEGTRGPNQFGPDPLGGERRALADDGDDDAPPRRSRRDRVDDDYEDDDRDERPRRR